MICLIDILVYREGSCSLFQFQVLKFNLLSKFADPFDMKMVDAAPQADPVLGQAILIGLIVSMDGLINLVNIINIFRNEVFEWIYFA